MVRLGLSNNKIGPSIPTQIRKLHHLMELYLDKIPLFWKDYIQSVNIYQLISENKLISAYNQSIIALACAGNILERGNLNPFSAASLIKESYLYKYKTFNNILILRDLIFSWNLKIFKDCLYVNYPNIRNFILFIKKKIIFLFNERKQ